MSSMRSEHAYVSSPPVLIAEAAAASAGPRRERQAMVATEWSSADARLARTIGRSVDHVMHQDLLFHGSLEPLNGKLKPGCDGMVWFADSPVIAQIYIPSSGGWTAVGTYDYLNRDPAEAWAPRSSFDEAAIRQAGFVVDDIKRDERWIGSLSWRCPGASPTLGDCRRLMVEQLGYPDARDFSDYWRVRSVFANGRIERILPASHRDMGTLVIVPRPEELRLLDLRNGLYGSDMCNSYRYTNVFQAAARDGYDGVIIDDLAQTERNGNLGHYGYGLFQRTADRLPELRIPAQHAEWDRNVTSTPELTALRQQVRTGLGISSDHPAATH